MRILAFLSDPPVVRSILVHLDLPDRPPPVAPARGPRAPREAWSGDFLLDQSPACDLTEPKPKPDYPFNSSLPDTSSATDRPPVRQPADRRCSRARWLVNASAVSPNWTRAAFATGRIQDDP
jgi:hypothetical protein